jgi:hypothetical protein
VLFGSAAEAAVVNTISSKISINRGNGYAPVGASTTAAPGDQVMASPSGSGEIVYEDGCREKVDPGTVVTVQATSPCKTGGLSHDWVVGGLVVAGGIAAGVVLASGNDHKPASP